MWLPATLIFSLLLCVPSFAQAQSSGTTRTYYIAADEVTWTTPPLGKNAITGRPFVGMEQIWTSRT